MQAFILAGGKGERLRPLTYKIPKPMVKIKGTPFLQYLLEMLKSYQITDIILSVGYLAEVIKDYFQDGSQMGINITYSCENKFMGTGGAMKLSEKYLVGDFIALYGDSYLPIDYQDVINYFKKSEKIGTLVVYDNSDKLAPNNIIIDSNDIIREYNKETPNPLMNGIDAGVMVLKKEVLNLIPEGKTLSFEMEIFNKLIKMEELIGYRTHQRFYDIGTLERLKIINGVLK